MSNITGFVKRFRDIMRNDPGINGDAQRIEQIAWMLFLKVYDAKEEEWEMVEENYVSIIPERCRWKNWASDDKTGTALTGDDLLTFIDDELFPTLQNLIVTPETPISKAIVKATFEDTHNFMKDGVLLRQILNIIDEIDFSDYQEIHAFADIYETILKELQNAGTAGEFYTPRAVTDFVAQMIQPQIGETMADYACGTGGFLTSWLKELRRNVKNTSDAAAYSNSIYGIEKKQFPYMLCVTNLLLHDIDVPQVFHANTLTRDVLDYSEVDKADVILMNPPYGGSEKSEVRNHFPDDLASSETSDLFLAVIMYRLRSTGRAAVILPEGFLSGTDSAQVALKRKLLTEFNLHTIIKLPNSTFAPYARVTTNILFFNAGERTREVWYYQHLVPAGQKNYSKTKPIQLSEFEGEKAWWDNRVEGNQSWCVSVDDIVNNNYRLDFKNPHQQEDNQNFEPETFIESIVEGYEQITQLWREISCEPSDASSLKKCRIGDLCEAVKGRSPIKKTPPGPYPLVVTAEERSSSAQYQFDCKAVCIPLVSSTGHGHASLKRIHFQQGKFALGNILCALYSRDENVLSTEYLYEYLSHYKDERLVTLMRGSANVSLNPRDILNASIMVPPIEEQWRIVERLKSVRYAIRQISELSFTVDEFKDAFQKMIFSQF